jgi:hypothetical protein
VTYFEVTRLRHISRLVAGLRYRGIESTITLQRG